MSKRRRLAIWRVRPDGWATVQLVIARSAGHAMALYRRIFAAPNYGADDDGGWKGYSVSFVTTCETQDA